MSVPFRRMAEMLQSWPRGGDMPGMPGPPPPVRPALPPLKAFALATTRRAVNRYHRAELEFRDAQARYTAAEKAAGGPLPFAEGQRWERWVSLYQTARDRAVDLLILAIIAHDPGPGWLPRLEVPPDATAPARGVAVGSMLYLALPPGPEDESGHYYSGRYRLAIVPRSAVARPGGGAK